MIIDIIGNDNETETPETPSDENSEPLRWDEVEDLQLEIVPVQPDVQPRQRDEHVIRQRILWNDN